MLNYLSACIKKSPTSEPEWLEGNATISRSPVAHIGDGEFRYFIPVPFLYLSFVLVQRVRLVGKPPDGVFCAFRNLRNVVVMPSRGKSVHIL